MSDGLPIGKDYDNPSSAAPAAAFEATGNSTKM